MNELKRTLLSIAARLLCYPDSGLDHDLQTIRKWRAQQDDESLREELTVILDAFHSAGEKHLQELYVSTFDWKEATGLYLTAHELGDSRKRGNALILLQRTISDAEFEWSEDELVDYIPMLYEFLAEVIEEDDKYEALGRRLASA